MVNKQLKTIAVNVSKKVPEGSQPLLLWNDRDQCYEPITRAEMFSFYDKKIKETEDFCNDKVAEMKAEMEAYKAEMNAKFAEFTRQTAEISDRMIGLVEANGGN